MHTSTRRVELDHLESRRLFSVLSTVGVFDQANGATPYASLIPDGAGNLLGDTRYGGNAGEGAIYSFTPDNGAINPIASLNLSNGEFPQGDLYRDQAGNLYGTASAGGAYLDGAVYTVPGGQGSLVSLGSFNGADGQTPSGQIVEIDGYLYGTTENGGANGDGAIYRISKSGGGIIDIASFNVANGQSPRGGLVADGAGNLFGVTYSGGANGDGTVFEINSTSSILSTLASFNVFNGQNPLSRLSMDSAGDLFGTTYAGGAQGNGSVFEVATGSNAITLLASFNIANGQYPQGDLARDASGDLFGITQAGGADGQGTVWELPGATNTINTLYSFTAHNDGGTPLGGVMLDASGNLFGTTSAAALGFGTIFEIPGLAFASSANGVLTIQGTPGSDTITLTGSSSNYTVTLNQQASQSFNSINAIVLRAGAGNDSVDLSSFTGTATVLGGAGNDTLVGGSGAGSIRGGAGDDSILGNAGNDTLVGGAGNDQLRGGAGDDSILGGPGNDTLRGNVGNDTLYAGLGADSLNGNQGNDSIVAGPNSSALDGGPGIDSVTGSIVFGYTSDTLFTGQGSDSIQFSPSDVLSGNSAGDSLTRVG